MVLDEIEKAYFRKNLIKVVGVSLEVSLDTYEKMCKEDPRVALKGGPDENGYLKPIFDRPFKVIPTNDFSWRWITP